jgi:chorismate mutase
MSDPLPTDPAPSTLDTIRTAIDSVDAQLLDLVLRRSALTGALRAAKPLGPTETPLRPAREVALLRRLLSKAGNDGDVVFEVWRALIGGSVRRQRAIEAFIGGAADTNRIYDIARRHFGTHVKITRGEDARVAITKMTETASAVAVAPFPGHSGPGVWWPMLSESRFHNVSIVAALPLWAPGEPPEAAMLAMDAKLEPAGGDQTLAIAFDPHHRLQRALSEARLAGKELARARTMVLIGLDGFIPAGDMRLTAMSSIGLESVRIVGAFARI